MVELSIVFQLVEKYETAHYPIAQPTIGSLIKNGLEEKGMTQKHLHPYSGLALPD